MNYLVKQQLVTAREQLVDEKLRARGDALGDFFVPPWVAHVEDLERMCREHGDE
jgi:hypothetical protein